MDQNTVPVGFGLALSQNEAAMIRYGLMSEEAKHDLLNHARGVRSDMEMYKLVASLANGWQES